MEAYSQDSRDRVLERGDRPTASANRFEVSRLWVYRCGPGSRRRDSGPGYRLGATGGHGWPGWSRHCGLGLRKPAI